MAIAPELNARITVRDDGSVVIDKFNKKLGDTQKTVAQTTKSFEQHDISLRKLSQSFIFLGTSMTAPLALAFNTTTKYSIDAANAMTQLKNTMDKFQVSIGSAIVPTVQKLADFIDTLYRKFNDLDPQLKTQIINTVLLSGAFFVLLGIGLKVITAIITLKTAFLQTVNQIVDFAKGLITVGGHLSGIKLGITAVISAILLMVIYWDKIKPVAVPVLGAIEYAVMGVTYSILKWVEAFLYLIEVINKIPDVLIPGLSGATGLPLGMFKTMFTGFQDDIVKTKNDIAAISVEMANLMTDLANNDFQGGNIEKFMDEVNRLYTEGIAKLGEIKGAVINFMTGDLGGTGANTFFSSLLRDMENFNLAFMKNMTTWMTQAADLGSKTSQIMTGMFDKMSADIGRAIGQMIMHGKNFGETMKEVMVSWAEMAIAKIVEVILQWIIMQTIGQVLAAASLAFASGIAAQLAAIWTPAATLASIASYGSAAGVGVAAVATALGTSQGITAGFTAGVMNLSGGGSIPAMAEGGIVTQPTVALIGERGREAVIPLDKADKSGLPGSNVNVYIDRADFRRDQNVEETFTMLVDMLNQNKRAKI